MALTSTNTFSNLGGLVQASSNFEIGGIIKTTSGLIQDKPSELRSNLSAYLRIPYAQPPVGELRFALPVPVSASQNNSNAIAFVSHDAPYSI